MEDSSSRHSQLATYKRPVSNSKPAVTLYQPRIRRAQETDRYHYVSAGERLDLLAYRYYNDPYLFWRVADANPSVAIEGLVEAGRTLTITKE